MFDIGAPELFIVAVLAIIVVGPKDLPKLIRSVMGMVRKVRDMGGEFQAGMKKMADEVELDAVTRKLNEAGNVDIDGTKPDIKPSAEPAEYDEFDYDDYDYDGSGYSPKPKAEKSEENTGSEVSEDSNTDAEPSNVTEETASEASEPVAAKEKVKTKKPVKKAAKPKKSKKSKTDD